MIFFSFRKLQRVKKVDLRESARKTIKIHEVNKKWKCWQRKMIKVMKNCDSYTFHVPIVRFHLFFINQTPPTTYRNLFWIVQMVRSFRLHFVIHFTRTTGGTSKQKFYCCCRKILDSEYMKKLQRILSRILRCISLMFFPRFSIRS